MQARESFGLSLFVASFLAAVACMAGAELAGLELTRPRVAIVAGLGVAAFLGFLVWIDAAADRANGRRD